MTALDPFVVRHGQDEFSTRMLIGQETRHVQTGKSTKQTQYLVTFELSSGGVRRKIKLCFADFVLNRFKEQTGLWLLEDEALLKRVVTYMFSRTGPEVPEIAVGQRDLENVVGASTAE